MEFQREEHGRKGAIFLDQDGEWVAELTYLKESPEVIVIDHTEVDESLRGQDVGKKLVAEAVKYARGEGLKIRATCPYAKRVLETEPEYADIIA